MDTRRNPSGISPLGSMLSSEELFVHSAAIFVNEAVQAEATGGGICSLTTLPSPTNVISAAAFLASSTGTFVCFWTPLNFDFFFLAILSQYRLFTSNFSSFWHDLVRRFLCMQSGQTAK